MENFIIDNRIGTVIETDLRLEAGEFVFIPRERRDALPVLPTVATPDENAYLVFASLEDEAAKEIGCAEGEAFENRYASKLLDFAQTHGPLFGLAGLSDNGKAEIREPVSDWLAAQSTMSSILKLIAFAAGDSFSHSNFDDCFTVSIKCTDRALTWVYSYIAPYQTTELYTSCLKNDFYTPFTTNDGATLSYIWSHKGIPLWFLEQFPFATRESDTAESMFAAAVQTYLSESYPDVLSTKQGQHSVPMSELRDHHEIREEAGALLKIVAERHTGGIDLGYRNYWSNCEKSDDGSYDIVSGCYLSYMWHELAQAYTSNHFRKCANPKCNAIISIDSKTSSGKRFCSTKCRQQANNLKNSEQCNRARNAYYQAKSFEEIYEEAFERQYSFKDPERSTLDKRLSGWIEKDFKKTQIGKSAFKQGAGKRQR